MNDLLCWHGLTDNMEICSPEWDAAHERYPHGATCLLPDGHEGPHEYTPDNKIMLTFEEESDG